MTAPRSEADQAMDRYADGDEGAFAVVYDVVAPRLGSYIRRQVRDRALADDILQQTFLNMHRARSTFVRGADVLPWAFAIARRLIIDGARQRRGQPSPEPLDTAPVPAGGDCGESLVQAQEAARRFAAELARLPAGQREAFVLLKQDGLSLQQAAHLMGTTVTSVKLRVHRALAALRATLEKDFRP
jgi:RNA polymerase sigma-70 factor (ECF subfamily)